jgi:release factor glutamine methyltransferase
MPEKPWTILKLLEWTATYFKEKNVAEPRSSAEVLLAHVLSQDRLFLYLNYDRPMEPQELSIFRNYIKRRVTGEPNQYITGVQEFWSLSFRVNPEVLIPRPETEVLVEAVLDFAQKKEHAATGLSIVDIGTGSGAVAVALANELPNARVVAVDSSMQALQLARENARSHQVEQQLNFVCGDILGGISRAVETFDVVVSNPPYVSQTDFQQLPREIRDHEPYRALAGGPEGLQVIGRIIAQAPAVLRQKGCLFLEIGAGQADNVGDLVSKANSYGSFRILKDYSEMDRVLVAEKS